TQLQPFQALDVAAAVCVTVVRRDAISVVVTVCDRGARDWGDSEITLIQAVAERTWEAVERTRAEVAALKSRAELARQAHNYDMTLSTLEDNIFHLDKTGRVLYANRRLLNLWQLKPGEEAGKNLYELNVSYELRRAMLAAVRHVFATGQSVRDESASTRMGTTRYFDYIMNPVFTADGQVDYVVGSARDITQSKRIQAENEQAERRKDEFLATLAHELRNPLAAAQNAHRLIRERDENTSWATGMLGRQLDHMGRLIDDLLDVSRVSRGLIELRTQRLDLTALLEQEADTLQLVCHDAGHELRTELPSAPVYVDADASRLQQIIGNLISNANKFSDSGHRIELMLACHDGQAVIRVRDYGIGMTQQQISRIFDLFMQVDTALEHSRSGLGLGLTLSKT